MGSEFSPVVSQLAILSGSQKGTPQQDDDTPSQPCVCEGWMNRNSVFQDYTMIATHKPFDQLLSKLVEVESTITNGPIVPSVTASEIRNFLASRYDFRKPVALDQVTSDVESML